MAPGTVTLLKQGELRVVIVGLAVLAGLVSSAQNVTTQRTQANNVAAAINAQAKPGDVVAFCPDLRPTSASTARFRIHPQYDMLTFPRRTGPAPLSTGSAMPTRVHAAERRVRGRPASQKAGSTHHVWLVWQSMYQTFGVKCETIASDLLNAATKAGGGGRNVVTARPRLYYEPMNLTEFATAGS